MEGTGNEKGKKKNRRKAIFPICLGIFVLLALALFWSEIKPWLGRVSRPKTGHEFLALQPEEIPDADRIITNASADPAFALDNVFARFHYTRRFAREETGSSCYLFLFGDGSVYSGELDYEKYRDYCRSGETDSYWDCIVNLKYRGRLWPEDLQVLQEEALLADACGDAYDWADQGIPNSSSRTPMNPSVESAGFWVMYEVGIPTEGNDSGMKCIYEADSEYHKYWLYDVHAWFVIRAIRESTMYKEWLQESFGDTWKDADDILCRKVDDYEGDWNSFDSWYLEVDTYYRDRLDGIGGY